MMGALVSGAKFEIYSLILIFVIFAVGMHWYNTWYENPDENDYIIANESNNLNLVLCLSLFLVSGGLLLRFLYTTDDPNHWVFQLPFVGKWIARMKYRLQKHQNLQEEEPDDNAI